MIMQENGSYKRCECLRVLNTMKFTDWAGASKEYIKGMNKLIDTNMKRNKKEANNKDVIAQFLKKEVIEELINKKFRIHITGTNGSGKTQTAITLAIEILKRMDLEKPQIQMNKFYILDVQSLKDDIYNEEKMEKKRKKAKTAEVLIIDGLGKETETPNAARKASIQEAIERMIKDSKGLIITTSKESQQQAYKKTKESIESMLYTGNTLEYEMQKRDFRKEATSELTFI